VADQGCAEPGGEGGQRGQAFGALRGRQPVGDDRAARREPVDLVDLAVERLILAEGAAQEPGRGDQRPACGGQRDVVVERGRAQVGQLAGGRGPVAGDGLVGDAGRQREAAPAGRPGHGQVGDVPGDRPPLGFLEVDQEVAAGGAHVVIRAGVGQGQRSRAGLGQPAGQVGQLGQRVCRGGDA
jgi:hypothetical protein